jgi:hypothetical protein
VTVKLAELVAVPAGVVTAITPLFAPVGTVALICVALRTVNEAGLVLNVTEVAPVKFVPVIVTVVPIFPLVGEKLVIVGAAGGAVTMKPLALVAVPPGVVTPISPLVAPLGTVAVICEALLTTKPAGVPSNVTDVAPVKFEPLIVTLVPTGPLAGEKPLIVGAEGGGTVTLKLEADVAVPPEVVTAIGPLVAPLGTVAVICELESTVNVADVPLNVTAEAPMKLEPTIVTLVPTLPLVGVKSPIVGATTAPEQPGSVNDPIRVSQLSSAFVVGWTS